MNSLAMKLDVTNNEQLLINQLIEKVGIKPQKRRFHCTVGFIDKMFASPQDANAFAEQMVGALQPHLDQSPLTYEVAEVSFALKWTVAFLPTYQSTEILFQVNQLVHKWVRAFSQNKYDLNHQTVIDAYQPHITLWRQQEKNHRIKSLQEELEKIGPLTLNLRTCSYTVL